MVPFPQYDTFDVNKPGLLSLVLDRPSLMLRNLLVGKYGAALRAITDPSSLTPDERRTFAQYFGGNQDTPTEKLMAAFGGLLDIAINPLLWGSALLTYRYGVATRLKDLFPLPAEGKEIIRHNPITAFAKALRERFLGEVFPEQLEFAHNRIADLQAHLLRTFQENGFEEWQRLTGKRAFSKETARRVYAHAANLYDPTGVWWRAARGRLEDLLKLPDLPTETRLILDDALTVLSDPQRFVAAAEAGALKEHEHLLVKAMRAVNDEIAQEYLTRVKPGTSTTWLNELKRLVRARYKDAGLTPAEDDVPKLLKNYMPELRLAPDRKILDVDFEAADEFDPTSLFNELMGTTPPQQTMLDQAMSLVSRLFHRTGKTMPHPDHLKTVGFDDEFRRAVDIAAYRQEVQPGVLGDPHYFTLDADDAMHRYIFHSARTITMALPPTEPLRRSYRLGETVGLDRPTDAEWLGPRDPLGNAPPLGMLLVNSIRKMGAEGRYEDMRLASTVYFPLLIGRASSHQKAFNHYWDAMRSYAAKALRPGSPLAKLFGEETAARWRERLGASETSANAVGAVITDYLYTSTLGANPVPAFFNAFQGLVQAFAQSHTLSDFVETLGRTTRELRTTFVEHVLKKRPLHEVVAEVNPGFAEGRLDLDPGLKEAVLDPLRQGEHANRLLSWGGKLAQTLMIPFSTSEFATRLLFYNHAETFARRELAHTPLYDMRVGGVIHVKPGDTDWEPMIRKVASRMTRQTQYGGGLTETPSWLVDKWPPFRQLLSYGLRQIGLVLGPMLRSPQFLAGALWSTGALYEGGKRFLNMDIGRGLIPGGIPLPAETGWQPFAPYPFVSPGLQIVGALGTAVAQGSVEPLQRALPLLIPGGVGLSRLGGYLPGIGATLGHTFKRPYADYSRMTPDGRFGVYDASDRLLGYYSPTQLVGRALGVGDVTGEREKSLNIWLKRQQDSIRDLKRQYLEAVFSGDTETAFRVQQEYTRRFPGVGPLPVRTEEVRAVHLRKDVARLERVLESLPAELRAQYMPVISTVLGASAPAIMGLTAQGAWQMQQSPTAFGARTINERDQYRAYPRQGVAQRMGVSQGLHGQKLSDKSVSTMPERRNLFPSEESE